MWVWGVQLQFFRKQFQETNTERTPDIWVHSTQTMWVCVLQQIAVQIRAARSNGSRKQLWYENFNDAKQPKLTQNFSAQEHKVTSKVSSSILSIHARGWGGGDGDKDHCSRLCYSICKQSTTGYFYLDNISSCVSRFLQTLTMWKNPQTAL